MRYLLDLLERPQLPIWQLPVAYAADGSRTYTLREIVDSKPAIKPSIQLTSDEWRQLVLTQMRSGLECEESGRTASTYQLSCPQGVVRNSRQAIQEIEERSALGERVIKGEREYLIALLQDVY
jgi:hypothetical protein